MSGWIPDQLRFELTPTKARYYWRRGHVLSVTEVLTLHGLQGVEEASWGGWYVQATIAQIWTALSGRPSDRESFRHEGREALIEAGVYTESEYWALCGLEVSQ